MNLEQKNECNKLECKILDIKKLAKELEDE